MPALSPAMSDPNPAAIPQTGPLSSIDALFSPRSIVVIGGTERPGSVGRALMDNLAVFPGPVFVVNPKRATVMGRTAVPSIARLPQPADLAVIATPAAGVPEVLRECGVAGIRAAIVISAGFKEAGPAGQALEAEAVAVARAAGIRLVGPNCLGVMSPHRGFNATFAAGIARPGHVAFLSQSGALCTAILDWSFREQVGFSAFVSVGSMADVGWGDLLDYFAEDPNTRSIVCYMESVGDARAFLSAARAVTWSKPVIVIKVGRTAQAARAAASHTGALTGSDDVLDAAFQRVGVVRVDTIGELFNLAEVLGKQPRPAGPRLAIVTNAGGPGALSTDLLVRSGGELAELGESSRLALDALLPSHWSHANPVDILGDADAERYAAAVDIVARDPGNDGTLVILTPQHMTDARATAARIAPLGQAHGKPLLTAWMGGPAVESGRVLLNEAGIPTYDYPDTAARAFALMWRYTENLRVLYETPPSTRHADRRDAVMRVDALLDGVLARGRTLLTEAEAKEVLAAYDIPVVPTLPASTVEEAVAQAARLGFPVVLKLWSETVTHKTDVGGVRLNLADPDAVVHAFDAIREGVAAKPGAFLGVTVQPMVRCQGHELILGSSVDPQFGPVLLFGAGGQWVEIFRDRALELPPLNASLARRLRERTRIAAALRGARGQAGVDLAALDGLLVRFGDLVVNHPRIAEIDINPLLAGPDGLVALDGRVVLHPASVADAALPRPAIRPYPAEYRGEFATLDGQVVEVRPIRPEDEPAMVKFHAGLSERSVYLRYFSAFPLAERTEHRRLARICFADYDREIALVAIAPDGGLAAVARLIRFGTAGEAEFGLLVADAWQGRGIGRELLLRLVHIARVEKCSRVSGLVLSENRGMLDLCRRQGWAIHPRRGEAACEVVIEL
ncbi:MAG: bifunctional acetate--CoA ligase family protein/GNAT family N-acetyltransferase [Verrucomicrobia bacterium]|nr:MAG: bifunctional acetate--CoA ligase family protein/GNAT family N-acetyltransferase [Verrucomicrobiota bacterium]